MTDELDRRLRGLVDDIEPAVLIAPASDTRARGTRRKLRHRTAAGVAAAAAVGVIATGFVALSGSDGRATGGTGVAASPADKPGMCRPAQGGDAAPGSAPRDGAPPSKPSATAPPDGSTPPGPASETPAPVGGSGLPDTLPMADFFVCAPGGTPGPLSPKALRVQDLPDAAAAWTNDGSWSGTTDETFISPGTFCLGNWPTGAGGVPAGLVFTSYRFNTGSGPLGHLNEGILTFATEAEAQAAEAALAADAASCQSRYPQSAVTQLGAPEGKLWKWDHAPDSYRGYEGFIRSGKTIVVLGYIQPGAFAAEFAPPILGTAIDRATS